MTSPRNAALGRPPINSQQDLQLGGSGQGEAGGSRQQGERRNLGSPAASRRTPTPSTQHPAPGTRPASAGALPSPTSAYWAGLSLSTLVQRALHELTAAEVPGAPEVSGDLLVSPSLPPGLSWGFWFACDSSSPVPTLPSHVALRPVPCPCPCLDAMTSVSLPGAARPAPPPPRENRPLGKPAAPRHPTDPEFPRASAPLFYLRNSRGGAGHSPSQGTQRGHGEGPAAGQGVSG